MPKLLGISGSLRKNSYNTFLVHAAVELLPSGSSLEVSTVHGIPLYDADEEAENGVPAPVEALKNRIAEADGLVIATPEYNNSMPGVLKTAIDWLSRPPQDIGRVFNGRPVVLMGASPGAKGTILSQTAWLQVWRTLGMRPWFETSLYVGGASKAFDNTGKLTDAATRTRLEELLRGFVVFAEKNRRSS